MIRQIWAEIPFLIRKKLNTIQGLEQAIEILSYDIVPIWLRRSSRADTKRLTKSLLEEMGSGRTLTDGVLCLRASRRPLARPRCRGSCTAPRSSLAPRAASSPWTSPRWPQLECRNDLIKAMADQSIGIQDGREKKTLQGFQKEKIPGKETELGPFDEKHRLNNCQLRLH